MQCELFTGRVRCARLSRVPAAAERIRARRRSTQLRAWAAGQPSTQLLSRRLALDSLLRTWSMS